MRPFLPLLSALAVLVFAASAPSPALAHGAMRRLQSACVLKVGPDFMYFSGYQPAASHRKFCEDIPETGDTFFVLDYAQPEMRDMSADFRIVRAGAEDADPAQLPAATVAYLPPKVYPHGTLSFEHHFHEAGSFVGIVTLDGPHGERWVSHFPFSVGRLYSARAPYYLVGVAVALALLVLLWGKEEARK
ncbi:hypothetical protein WOC76_05460 [Methylocystis sp. IM3]|uniref:hypothetical protein n=1 Tax=unclassified Methylocystis TaxID=2625913 RepID=UPI0030F5FB36